MILKKSQLEGGRPVGYLQSGGVYLFSPIYKAGTYLPLFSGQSKNVIIEVWLCFQPALDR